MTISDIDALARYRDAEKLKNIALWKFAKLDFDVFNAQDWDRVKDRRSDEIRVHWPDGTVTVGPAQYAEVLKVMCSPAPDCHVSEHPIRVGDGDWTSVVGIVDGTFTQPMARDDGTFIAPTGKHLHMTMCTVGHWTNGMMDEEYLFWDTQLVKGQLLDD